MRAWKCHGCPQAHPGHREGAEENMNALDLPKRMPRRRDRMIEYLAGHYRYPTMNSWNSATSYAHCIKIHHLCLTSREADACFALLDLEGCYEESGFGEELREFDRRWDYAWQIGQNGRSGGYLALYQGGKEHTAHWSYCTRCGQRNFKLVPPRHPTPEEHIRLLAHRHPWTPEVIYRQYADKADPAIAFFKTPEAVLELLRDEKARTRGGGHPGYNADNRCGRCGQRALVNYPRDRLPVRTYTRPGLGTDVGVDFHAWETPQLRDRVEMVWDFDQACQRAVHAFVDFALNVRPGRRTSWSPTASRWPFLLEPEESLLLPVRQG